MAEASTANVSCERAIEIARERVPGRVLDTEMKERGGLLVYDIETEAKSGTRSEISIDAHSGAVIRVKHLDD